MNIPLLTRLTALGVILAAVPAWAQKADSFDFYASNLNILQAKEVQAEIKLTAAQKNSLNKHANWFNGESKKIQTEAGKKGANQKALGERMNKLLSQLKSRAIGELSATQTRRLREISLQLAGPAVILDDQVSRRIGISAAQLKKMRDSFSANTRKAAELQEKTLRPIMQKYEKMTPKTDAEKKSVEARLRSEMEAANKKIDPQLKAIYDQTRRSLNGLMTDAQRKAFAALLGRPFTPKPPAR